LIICKKNNLKGINNQNGKESCSNGKGMKLKSVKQIPGPTPLPIFGTTMTSSALKMSDLFKANQGILIFLYSTQFSFSKLF
jgi:hypothetical protein